MRTAGLRLDTLTCERRHQPKPHDRQTNIRKGGNDRQNHVVKAPLNQDAGIAMHVIDHPSINQLRQSPQGGQKFQAEQSENKEYQQTGSPRYERHSDKQSNVNSRKHDRLHHWQPNRSEICCGLCYCILNQDPHLPGQLEGAIRLLFPEAELTLVGLARMSGGDFFRNSLTVRLFDVGFSDMSIPTSSKSMSLWPMVR